VATYRIIIQSNIRLHAHPDIQVKDASLEIHQVDLGVDARVDGETIVPAGDSAKLGAGFGLEEIRRILRDGMAVGASDVENRRLGRGIQRLEHGVGIRSVQVDAHSVVSGLGVPILIRVVGYSDKNLAGVRLRRGDKRGGAVVVVKGGELQSRVGFHLFGELLEDSILGVLEKKKG